MCPAPLGPLFMLESTSLGAAVTTEGIGPSTPCFVGRCSVQLSYVVRRAAGLVLATRIALYATGESNSAVPLCRRGHLPPAMSEAHEGSLRGTDKNGETQNRVSAERAGVEPA